MRFVEAITRDEVSIIGDYKRRSPYHGEFTSLSPVEVAKRYEALRFCAMSVVVDEGWGGTSRDAVAAKSATEVPVMAKHVTSAGDADWLARCGIDALLLVARELPPRRLDDLVEVCRQRGIACVIEVFNERELDRVLPYRPEVIAINRRDLLDDAMLIRDNVDVVIPYVPRGTPVIACSGYDLNQATQVANADAVLVGAAALEWAKTFAGRIAAS